MQNSAATAGAISRTNGFSVLVLESIFRHRAIHAVALFTLGLGFVVGGRVGNLPDFKLLGEYALYLVAYFWLVGCAYALFQLFWLCVTRTKSPIRHLTGPLLKTLTDRNRVVNALNGLTAMLVFMTGFVVLKGAIAVLVPFSWDQSLAHFSTKLHFGRAPYQWLWWIFETPGAIHFLNFCYSFWFVVMVATVISSAMAGKDSLLRHQFLLSFMLVWLIGGFFIAMAFSSAGPCYYAKLGLGDLYKPLMDALESANRQSPIWALKMQDRLWSGYSGSPSGTMGISAFPSIHVASSVLFALYATRLSTALGAMMWLFAAIIMVASVLLGWHYGIDGYGGALIAIAIWKATGAVLSRTTDNGALTSTGASPWAVDRPLPQ
jgi:membrane-associated phospholipid phosphatase